MPAQKKILTIAQAADYLKVSKTSLRRWTNSGRLACYRVGHRNERRFLLDDLVSFMGEAPGEGPLKFKPLPDRTDVSPGSDEHAQTPRKQAPRKHICTYYKSPEEQWELLRSHLLSHLNADAKTAYIYHRDEQQLLAWLRKEDIEPQDLIKSGVLELYASADTYLEAGYFSTERMLSFWQKIITRHNAEGVKSLLLTGEMGWASSGATGCEQLVPYEATLDAMLEATPWVTVICQYPVYQFSGSTVFDNLCVHTHVQLPDRLETGFGPVAAAPVSPE